MQNFLGKKIDIRYVAGLQEKEREKESLFKMQAKLDALVHSKQYGREYAETTAIVVLGALTSIITLLSKPEIVSEVKIEYSTAGFVYDLFGFIFAGTIAFLVFHVFDLNIERNTSIMERTSINGNYRVEFREFKREGTRRDWLWQILCTVGGVIAISLLLVYKWLWNKGSTAILDGWHARWLSEMELWKLWP